MPRDAAEIALAHVIENQVIENKLEAPYRRGELLSERRKIMRERAS
ncbi:MAG: hypothetical protein ACFCVA_15525 [Gammaproteobacteria bacterium]